jgi:hypothetical protein
MSGLTIPFDKPAKMTALVVAAVFSISNAAAGATCGICDTEIVINSELASCFLEQYDKLAALNEQAIVVDLSDCAESRGIVEALPSANLTVDEPDTEFMISPSQLACLKQKLEDPNIELDPSATIDLAACI